MDIEIYMRPYFYLLYDVMYILSKKKRQSDSERVKVLRGKECKISKIAFLLLCVVRFLFLLLAVDFCYNI